ncbi:excinuclease ABC subunit A [Campylobacter sp. RM16188]|uniref:excinuclease ABC subunit A n=1 Tax=Campylobacter sp. RM16188 TaxID=1705725 RepID=UPI001553729E|nr:excinuclease ABC subunit A [Campylobacter sp. RM16188]
MRILSAIFALAISLFASNLLTYNIYERSDRVDIMLSFDAPYEGNIFQKHENDMTMLIFNALNFDQVVDKNINSKILQEIYIEPKQNSVVLSLKSSSNVAVTASKTTDGFGLRVRVIQTALGSAENENRLSSVQINAPSPIPSQSEESLVGARYYMVIGVLFALLITLFIIKRTIRARGGLPYAKTPKFANLFSKNKNGGVEVLYEKPLDRFNKVMLLSHMNKKYLVLVGNSNVLLDKFGEDKIENEDDFEAFFEENKRKLGQFLEERQNSLSAYKDKASKD